MGRTVSDQYDIGLAGVISVKNNRILTSQCNVDKSDMNSLSEFEAVRGAQDETVADDDRAALGSPVDIFAIENS